MNTKSYLDTTYQHNEGIALDYSYLMVALSQHSNKMGV